MRRTSGERSGRGVQRGIERRVRHQREEKEDREDKDQESDQLIEPAVGCRSEWMSNDSSWRSVVSAKRAACEDPSRNHRASRHESPAQQVRSTRYCRERRPMRIRQPTVAGSASWSADTPEQENYRRSEKCPTENRAFTGCRVWLLVRRQSVISHQPSASRGCL